MQYWKYAQQRYCAGPRLDRTRDASLVHQRSHGAAHKQQAAMKWYMVAVGSNKHKGIAQKQDISEEHRNFRVVNLNVKNLILPDVFWKFWEFGKAHNGEAVVAG